MQLSKINHIDKPYVSIVGAGPGDPELLTIKAYRHIISADAIIYDRLIAPEITSLFPKDAALIYAGKERNHHILSQDEINEQMVRLAQENRFVVRLKGGDPFIFGRGSEEAIYLIKHNIPFEIIPAVNSASGCAASSLMPLTHRGIATSVRFVTGHVQKNGELNLNWQSLADPDCTLVFFMPITAANIITSKLIKAGLSPKTPAAFIENGTRPDMRILRGSLDNIAKQGEDHQVKSPSLLFIGLICEVID